MSAADPASTADERNPWLGLASFTEESRSLFFGRDAEVAELARRVQRKLLTVLFGKSGLGKTSILRAGLVPRLREQGYCPVYVRIDYAPDTPEPAEQIKEAIRRAACVLGESLHAGRAAAGTSAAAASLASESLWEFLHHRDNASTNTLKPFLIFDQFEELFTLAQSDELGRARAARFLEQLADLVENRPSKELEARIERDETAAELFDFARSDYRVLIALREDYLAPLESLRKSMPSLAQNRLRLAPMTGAQALEAVLGPGRSLLSEEVAAAIVRFVAGGAELSNAEVEPSLLSLICRELNDARIAQGRSEISLDLLAGSHATILANFYERALADQPASVRRIIEDELLTDSGFRENMAEESLIRRFQAAGAESGSLATLVNRRLLRIEERLDVRRVELTHDVLCGIVKQSRDQRHEREARETTERLLAEQRAREQTARHALTRARAIAIGCTLLAVFALLAAVFAYLSAQRARRAERTAQQIRAAAEQARSQSEHLLAYLADDFAPELESWGRLQMLAEFSQRQIDYFHALPRDLRGTDTLRNGALALIIHATALRYLGDTGTATRNSDEALQLLEGLRAREDHSDTTLVALGRGYSVRCMILVTQTGPGVQQACDRAAAILEPLASRPGAPLSVRRAYVEALTRTGYMDMGVDNEAAARIERQAMELAAGMGAHDLHNIDTSASYVEAGGWLVNALANLGRNDAARRTGEEVLALADRILQQRPAYRLAWHAKQITLSSLAGIAQAELDPKESLRLARQSEQVSLAMIELDPNNVAGNLGAAQSTVGDSLWAAGRLEEALGWYRKSLDSWDKVVSGGRAFALTRGFRMAMTTDAQATFGDMEGATATVVAGKPFVERIITTAAPGSFEMLAAELLPRMAEAKVAYERGDLAAASALTAAALGSLQRTHPERDVESLQRAFLEVYFSNIAGHASYRLGKFAAAEQAERLALEQRKVIPSHTLSDQRDMAEMSTWLAMALARRGKLTDAQQTIGPVVELERGLMSRNRGDVWVPYELACALYAQSLAEPARRAALLQEAGSLLNHLAPALQKLHDVQFWREQTRHPGPEQIRHPGPEQIRHPGT